MTEMGFSEEAAREALEANEWDETRAINSLLSG
jgi:NACalpha-BTF3-like transcription factor